MSRWANNVVVAGNVKDVLYGETSAGHPAGSFMLAVAREPAAPVWVRVNVYDGLVKLCREKLGAGGWVRVEGALMNRTSSQNKTDLVEIRCKSLKFNEETTHGPQEEC